MTTTPDLLARFANGLYARSIRTGRSVTSTRAPAPHLSLRRRADGSASIAGELTCEAAEYLETLFDTLGGHTRSRR